MTKKHRILFWDAKMFLADKLFLADKIVFFQVCYRGIRSLGESGAFVR